MPASRRGGWVAEQKCLKAPAQEILVERAEMEAIQKDSSRLTARGRGASANLKREMGMQDRIKKLPKLTEVPQIYHLSRLHTLLSIVAFLVFARRNCARSSSNGRRRKGASFGKAQVTLI